MTGSPVLDRLAASLGPGFDAGVEQVGEETCPACEGERVQVEFYGPGVERGYAFVPFERLVACDRCGGEGTVPITAFVVRPTEPLVDAPKPQPIPLGGDTDDHVPF